MIYCCQASNYSLRTLNSAPGTSIHSDHHHLARGKQQERRSAGRRASFFFPRTRSHPGHFLEAVRSNPFFAPPPAGLPTLLHITLCVGFCQAGRFRVADLVPRIVGRGAAPETLRRSLPPSVFCLRLGVGSRGIPAAAIRTYLCLSEG